jgi:hypothetical protein
LRAARVRGYFQSMRMRSAMLLMAMAAPIAGCQQVMALPPSVTVAQIEASGHPAKDPNCPMPILHNDPLADFRKVAIIEAVGNVFAKETDVMPVVTRKACEIGAEAIIIVASKSQTSENLTGYYINAVAIIYQKKAARAVGAPGAH